MSSPPEQEGEIPPVCLPYAFGSRAAVRGLARGARALPCQAASLPLLWAGALGYPELSCSLAPLQRVPRSPAWWEEVVRAHGERRGGLPGSLQP